MYTKKGERKLTKGVGKEVDKEVGRIKVK